MKRLKTKYKYDWVPHEVRRDQAESIVAYVLIGLVVMSIPLAFFIMALKGLE